MRGPQASLLSTRPASLTQPPSELLFSHGNHVTPCPWLLAILKIKSSLLGTDPQDGAWPVVPTVPSGFPAASERNSLLSCTPDSAALRTPKVPTHEGAPRVLGPPLLLTITEWPDLLLQTHQRVILKAPRLSSIGCECHKSSLHLTCQPEVPSKLLVSRREPTKLLGKLQKAPEGRKLSTRLCPWHSQSSRRSQAVRRPAASWGMTRTTQVISSLWFAHAYNAELSNPFFFRYVVSLPARYEKLLEIPGLKKEEVTTRETMVSHAWKPSRPQTHGQQRPHPGGHLSHQSGGMCLLLRRHRGPHSPKSTLSLQPSLVRDEGSGAEIRHSPRTAQCFPWARGCETWTHHT